MNSCQLFYVETSLVLIVPTSGGRTSNPTISKGENALRYLFLTWLQISNIHEFRPNGPRNISGRILAIAEKTTIDKTKMNRENLYLSHKKYQDIGFCIEQIKMEN
jgi:hypothetical protein